MGGADMFGMQQTNQQMGQMGGGANMNLYGMG